MVGQSHPTWFTPPQNRSLGLLPVTGEWYVALVLLILIVWTLVAPE
jgi:hypothetical protein